MYWENPPISLSDTALHDGLDQIRTAGGQRLQDDVEVLDESVQDLGHHFLLLSIRIRFGIRIALAFRGEIRP